MNEPVPLLSVALLTPDGFEPLRRTVTRVAAQDIASSIELLVLAPAGRDVGIDDALASSFHSVRVLPVA